MLLILFHELKYYFKNWHEAIYFYGLFALVILLFPLGLKDHLHLLPELAPGVLLLGLVVMASLGAATVFQRDAESGILEVYQQLPSSLVPLVLGKWVAFYSMLLLPVAVFVPALLVLFQLPIRLLTAYWLAGAAGGAAISLIALLAAVVSVGLERARGVMLLMILPLMVPVIIFASVYLQAPAQLWQPALLFLLAYSLFLAPILALAGASCIRASN